MSRQVLSVLYVAAMVAIIVGIDVAFLRDRFWVRLVVNVGIVLAFLALYVRFFRGPR
jgi:MFS-type transporter involved in bile tolerance (Atg22 family)